MSATTGIAWTSSTWNPIRGCSRVSAGCKNCYAEKVAARFVYKGENIDGTVKEGPFFGFVEPMNGRWTGRVELVEKALLLPLRWREPRRIFVNSMSDLFHENLPDEAIDRVFAVMALAPRHTFQVLTKRPERMRAYMESRSKAASFWKAAVPTGWALEWKGISMVPFPLPNVWLGVSAEDQRTADERIPLLLQTPAAVRFVSAEPLLGAMDLRHLQPGDPPTEIDALSGTHGVLRPHGGRCDRLDWVITGGESGHGARPCDLVWIRSIVQQCGAAGVACFVKQVGPRPVCKDPDCPGPCCGGPGFYPKDRKGADPDEWPEDLRVQEFPGGAR